MRRTWGYHLVKSGYGLWLPGDERGHWSSAWDAQIGYCQPHHLNVGDPVRQRMAAELMKYPAVRFTPEMIEVMAATVGWLISESAGGLSVSAAAFEPTHLHLQIPYSGRDIDRTTAWLSHQVTSAVHAQTSHVGPVFCKGRWRVFIFDESHWRATRNYIERHNSRAGRPAQPFNWIAPL
ncbi:MAG: hypothetical protein IT445_15780 [Phycisphaeraceae bacterium]|nr:hypothetical protein [Phycisphaeraceae bacterium]